MFNVPLDAIPDLSDPQVIIYTEWPGRSPNLVEDQITYPIISSMLAAPHVAVVRGTAREYGDAHPSRPVLVVEVAESSRTLDRRDLGGSSVSVHTHCRAAQVPPSLEDMARVEPTLRRWTRLEYERLIEHGFFQPGDPVELVGGALIVAEPQGSTHFTSIQLVDEALRAGFGRGWVVRVQGPIALDDESEPEPDVAVVPGRPRDYVSAHPARPVLVVEISESSLALDREVKGSLYARAGVTDYWIINLVDRVVEVYRDPAPEPSARHGWHYTLVRTVAPPDSVAPLAVPGALIPVSDLLP